MNTIVLMGRLARDGSARWGNAEDIKPYMSEDPWMNIPLTATEGVPLDGS